LQWEREQPQIFCEGFAIDSGVITSSICCSDMTGPKLAKGF
jgi:hypothetical protein